MEFSSLSYGVKTDLVASATAVMAWSNRTMVGKRRSSYS